jgi:enamine deaminase RidA (YjgF/YER057c/UK114 family)
VRLDPIIALSGTAPLDSDGHTVAVSDPAGQAHRCLEIAQAALEDLGASLSDVVRTRIFLTRIEDWQAVATVHGKFFGRILPVSTVIQVNRFVDPDWLVEIEVDAVIGAEG